MAEDTRGPAWSNVLSEKVQTHCKFIKQKLVIEELPLDLFSAWIVFPFRRERKKTPAYLYKYKPSNILQSCVIASEFCYHIALLIRIQNISHHHGHILNIVVYLQLCLGFVLYKGSHPYITKLNHCSILCSSSAPTSRSICPCSLGRDDHIDS